MKSQPQPLQFRRFQPADAEMLFPWLEAAGLRRPGAMEDASWIERICNDPRILCVTGEAEGGAVCGFLRLDVGPDRSAEVTLIVGPPSRRRGMGHQLLEQALREARRMGLKRLLAVVREDNLPAQRFFARKGFEPTGVWMPNAVHLARVVHGSEAPPPLEITV